MNLSHIIITLHFFIVRADNDETIHDQFYQDTRKPSLIAKEGVKVTLTCSKASGSEVYIITFGSSILIDSSNMTYISSKYGFIDTNDNTYVLTINRISKEDDGVYRCVQNPGLFITTRAVTVIYSPSERSPQCSSNYQSPVIFFNEMTQYFIFNCSTEIGKPPVNTAIYVNEEKVTSGLEIINETRTDKENIPTQVTTYTILQGFNGALQNYYFVCNITQELPSSYGDYQASCSFGPLHLLSGFSLSVSPSHVTVRDESNVTLICASNVTGVEITWNNIPSGKYNETKHNGSSVLTILSFKPSYNGTVFVECIGSYGSRTITTNTTVLLINTKEDDNKNNEDQSNNNISVPAVIIGFSICVFAITFLLIIVISCWKGKKSKGKAKKASSAHDIANPSISNFHEEGTLTITGETNTNANNTSVCLGMCKNVIYEPASFEHMEAECCKDEKMLSGKNPDPLHEIGNYDLGDHHLICENVLYQSFSDAKKEGRITTDLAS